MTMEREGILQVAGDIEDSAGIIVVPISAESTLRYGFYPRLAGKKGQAYTEFRDRFGKAYPTTADRAVLHEARRPVFARDLPLVIWIVRSDKQKAVLELDALVTGLIAGLVERRIWRICIARSSCLSQRMSSEDFDTMLLLLNEAGIGVDVYQ